jgi:putrescine---pyruvate transaminase
MVTPTDTTRLQSWDRAHHVHPFTDAKTTAGKPVRVMTRGDGVYVWDSEDNRFLDGMAGLWCVNVGYGRRELVEAATRQLEELPYYNTFWHTATPPQIELSRRLAELTPAGLGHFFFAGSGSEANDTVVRLVRHYWRVQGRPTKRIFIGRTLAYHGSTLAAVSLGGMPHMHGMEGTLLPEFEHIEHPHWYTQGGEQSREEFGRTAAGRLEAKIRDLGPERVAAFIGEPVQGAGGVFEPPPGYWAEIQRICRAYDVLLVADEVICGFGRTGRWFGSQTYDIAPDLMSMAKGITSGYVPLAAVAMTDRIEAALETGGLLAHGYTYSGHPVACAVALANLTLMEREGLVERVRTDVGPYFQAGLAELARAHLIVGEARGAGLIGALQLVRDKAARQLFTNEEGAAVVCREFALQNGLIMRAVNQAMVLSPPLVITRPQLDEMFAAARRALDATARQFGIS